VDGNMPVPDRKFRHLKCNHGVTYRITVLAGEKIPLSVRKFPFAPRFHPFGINCVRHDFAILILLDCFALRVTGGRDGGLQLQAVRRGNPGARRPCPGLLPASCFVPRSRN
jgi:hypothetical protein